MSIYVGAYRRAGTSTYGYDGPLHLYRMFWIAPGNRSWQTYIRMWIEDLKTLVGL